MAKTVALKKYLSAGEQLFHKSKCLDALIQQFEACIQRPYFHVKALDESQLKNWHLYLDFVETQRDFDWIVKLYERCLIPCASYPEFWIRYVQSMEDKGGREIANAALLRATQIFLKRMPAIHLFAARFKEQVRDISGAHSEFLNYNLDSFADYVENVIRKANMEKRLGNVEAACVVYERALEFAREGPRLQALPVLSIHYSQFKLMVTGSIEEARDILIKGIQQLPLCKLLYEALINFETVHGGPKQVALLESIIQKAVAPEADAADALSSSDREQISNLFLELVDCCGDVHQVKRAWDMHVRLFPHLFRPNYFQGNATAGYKYPFLTNLGGPLCTECGKKLHHPQHFAPESASSQQKLSNMPEVCQSEDKIVEPNVEHVTEALSFLDMTVRVPEHEAASNWEWQDQQVSHPREKIFEQSKVETLSGKPIYEAESESVQPQFELQYPKLEIALQPPPLETLSINPLQHEDHPSCSTSTHESKVPFLISHSNGSLTRGVNDNKLTIRYDEVQTQADLLQSKQDKTEYDISKTTKSPSLQLTGTPIAEATETKTHEVLPVNCVPHNQDHAVGNWQQMQYTGQPCATPGFGYQVYAQQHQQWQVAASMASYPPVDARCQVHPHHGYPYPLEYQYQVPPSAYHGSIQTWPVQNLQQTVVLAPQPQQNTDTVPFYYHQGQPSHYATPGAGYYGAAQTQQGFSWHLQQQHQQQLQQQQEWNSSHYQQRAAHVQYNANVPYGQEYDEQAVTPQVEGAVCPTSGPAALVHSQVQTSSSQ